MRARTTVMTATRPHGSPAPRRRGRSGCGFSISGVVQGVGFRPFVHRLATELGLSGFVGNDAAVGVRRGPGSGGRARRVRAPAAAPRPRRWRSSLSVTAAADADVATTPDSAIVASIDARRARARSSRPTWRRATTACAELFDPADRRYRHPFITCTDCGPRLTIIRDLPYDRPATTMAGFPMCADCAREYADVTDRRFHAQPIACPDCGPVLRFERTAIAVVGADSALAAAQRALAGGADRRRSRGSAATTWPAAPTTPTAIARLRAAQVPRPEAVRPARARPARRRTAWPDIDAAEERVLTGRARPIVLLRRRSGRADRRRGGAGQPAARA